MFATGGVMAACAGSACMTATCSCFGAVGGAIAKISARALYVALFVLTTALAVVMRDYAKPMLAKLPWIVHAAGGAAGFEGFLAVGFDRGVVVASPRRRATRSPRSSSRSNVV